MAAQQYFIKCLDKDPKLNVQYHTDSCVRESCFELTFILSHFVDIMSRNGSDSRSKDTGYYTLPQLVSGKYRPESFGNWFEDNGSFSQILDLLKLFQAEYEHRFQSYSPSAGILSQFNGWDKRFGHRPYSQRHYPIIVDRQYWRDKHGKEVKDVKKRHSLTGREIKVPKGVASIIKTHRAWYKEVVLKDLEVNLEARYTNRPIPEMWRPQEVRVEGGLSVPRPRRAEPRWGNAVIVDEPVESPQVSEARNQLGAYLAGFNASRGS